MPIKRKTPARYRLKFGGTRKTLPASSLKTATADARYWLSYGQKQVCIEKRLPSGRYDQVKCLRRK